MFYKLFPIKYIFIILVIIFDTLSTKKAIPNNNQIINISSRFSLFIAISIISLNVIIKNSNFETNVPKNIPPTMLKNII